MASDDIIHRIGLEEQDTLLNENEDDKILSEWSQWTKDPKLSHEKSNSFDIDLQGSWRIEMDTRRTDADKIQAAWSDFRHRPTKSELKRAAMLALVGHLTSVKNMNIEDIDITDIPFAQMKQLTAIVTERVCIAYMTPTSLLGSILACVKCPKLYLDCLKLSEENTRALVTIMRERVKIVVLGDVTLDMEEFTRHDGLGCCRKLRVVSGMAY